MSKSLYQTNVESRAPLTTDVGVVGNLWIDTSTTTPTLYLCTVASGGTYTWTQMANIGDIASVVTTALNTPV